DPEQPGESLYMTSHHPSADYLQEMPSPMRHEYTTSPVRSPRTSGDVRPQSRQSSEYMAHSSQEFSDPQLRTTHMEPDVLHESLGEPYLEATRSDRSERSRSRGSRGRSISPYSDTGTGEHPNPSVSRSSESPSPPPTERRRPTRGYTPDDSIGMPLTSPSISRRARSSRRSTRETRERRSGGNGSAS
ncbi:635_t:CDS:1, partial [Racocetra persica]